MTRILAIAAVFVVSAVGSGTYARKARPIELRFVPQENTSAVQPLLTGHVTERPVVLELEDARDVPVSVLVGEQIDGREWQTTANPMDAIERFVLEVLRGWSVRVSNDANLKLSLAVTKYYVTETENIIGSMYRAEVALRATLKDGESSNPWTGWAQGEARRFGSAQSAENCNEVLSDALKEALAKLLGHPGIQAAWAPDGDSAESEGDSIAADALLQEMLQLQRSGVGTEVVDAFARQHRLAAPLTAADIMAWKEAGIPESVIRAAMQSLAATPGAGSRTAGGGAN